jgi:hypothetical protein
MAWPPAPSSPVAGIFRPAAARLAPGTIMATAAPTNYQGSPELFAPASLVMSGRLDSNQRPPEPHSAAWLSRPHL